MLAGALTLAVFVAAAGAAVKSDPALERWQKWPYRVGCSDLSVNPTKAFTRTSSAEQGEGNPETELRHFLASTDGVPKRGWRPLARTSERAEFVHGRLDEGLLWLGLDLDSYRWIGGGPLECEPRSFRNGNPAQPWFFDLDAPAPDPSAESVTVAIHEQACTGGRNPITHLERPVYTRYGKRAIVVIFWTERLEGPHSCPGNPIGRLELKLPGPVGDRKLFDGSTYPPRRVKAGEDPRYPWTLSRSAFLRQ